MADYTARMEPVTEPTARKSTDSTLAIPVKPTESRGIYGWLSTLYLMLQFKDPTHKERGQWVQDRAGEYSLRYSKPNDEHHVLIVYQKSKYTANFLRVRDLRSEDGVYIEGPTSEPSEVISWKIPGIPFKFHYNVWIFKEGTFDLHSDGGFINWCWETPSCTRNNKHVECHKLD